MQVQVECHPGHQGEQEPLAFTLGARRFEVEDLLDRWFGRTDRHYKVRVDDGRVFILRHDARSGEWEIAALVGSRVSEATPSPVRH